MRPALLTPLVLPTAIRLREGGQETVVLLCGQACMRIALAESLDTQVSPLQITSLAELGGRAFVGNLTSFQHVDAVCDAERER